MKTIIKVVLTVFLVTNYSFAQVGINTTTPGSGSILDISSSDKGVLFPNIALTSTTVAAPVSNNPTNGLLIFNTATAGSGDTAVTPGYYYWDSSISEWVKFTTGEQADHYVGELYGGGIVFYVYQNGTHGLIASFEDLNGGSGTAWGPSSDVSTAESLWDGASNTANAVAAGAASTDAVKLCENYSNGGYSDWHLPSITEFKALEDASYVLAKVLETDGDSNTNYPDYNGKYWSSTQANSSEAYLFKFQNTDIENEDKSDDHLVRAIRSF
jgi:hypothetical protein